MKKIIQVVAISLVMLVLAGCGRVDVSVNAYRAQTRDFPPATADNTVAIATGSDLGETLLLDEVAAKAAYLIAQRGYTVVPRHEARYLLSCWFSMDSGRQYTDYAYYNEPWYPYGYYGGFYRGYYPGFGMGGGYYMPYTYVAFCKFMGLTLYDNQQLLKAEKAHPAKSDPEKNPPNDPNQTPRQVPPPFARYQLGTESPAVLRIRTANNQAIIWQCTAANCNSSTDLRQMVNYLLLGGFRYFGEDTGKQQQITVDPRNEDTKQLFQVTR